MSTPPEIIQEHFKEQLEGWAAAFMGKPEGHEFTTYDWIQFGNHIKMFIAGLVNYDALFVKLLQVTPGEELDKMYATFNKRLAAIRKEIGTRT